MIEFNLDSNYLLLLFTFITMVASIVILVVVSYWSLKKLPTIKNDVEITDIRSVYHDNDGK